CGQASETAPKSRAIWNDLRRMEAERPIQEEELRAAIAMVRAKLRDRNAPPHLVDQAEDYVQRAMVNHAEATSRGLVVENTIGFLVTAGERRFLEDARKKVSGADETSAEALLVVPSGEASPEEETLRAENRSKIAQAMQLLSVT